LETDIIFGRNPVIEAFKSGVEIDTVYINGQGGSLTVIRNLAAERGIVVKEIHAAKLSTMCGNGNHQGVAATISCATYVTIEDILAISANKGTSPFIVICDGIEDPHNLGAIIRTAEAAGCDGMIIPKRRSASLNSTVHKTSAGAASFLPVAKVSNLVSAIEILKKNGVWIFGTDGSGTNYKKVDFKGSVGLVIGSEGEGLSKLVREKCDFLVSLPMRGQITSLNASVAAGIFLYEIAENR